MKQEYFHNNGNAMKITTYFYFFSHTTLLAKVELLALNLKEDNNLQLQKLSPDQYYAKYNLAAQSCGSTTYVYTVERDSAVSGY